jgi:large subunit ribosomal protein L6
MSRIGKKPVPIPAGVTASMEAGTLSVKGPKGELKMPMSDLISYEMQGDGLLVKPANGSKAARAFASSGNNGFEVASIGHGGTRRSS